jgi:hypothetical protein
MSNKDLLYFPFFLKKKLTRIAVAVANIAVHVPVLREAIIRPVSKRFVLMKF